MIFMIFLGADLMNSALALTQVPGQLAGGVEGGGRAPRGGGGPGAVCSGVDVPRLSSPAVAPTLYAERHVPC